MMKKDHIPYRQIHLDFHTNKTIMDVGKKFDADEFVATLKAAHVNSINLFTKCHHGMYYYPSELGDMHPALNGFDLYGAQSKACKEAGIRVIAYTCVGWNEDTADKHPEWLLVNYDGILGDKKPFASGFTTWNTLCYFNKEYRELMKKEFKETWEKYKPEGFWIDIIQGHQCVCPECKKDMLERGMDPTDRNEVIRHDRMTEIAFCKEMYEFIKELDPNSDVYFNSMPYALDDGTDVETSSVTKREYFSFQDIESLPSDDWGYNHFPIAASYINKYDQEIAMMNGKFHFSWGDFGSMRNVNALEYECFRALSYGAKICVGDQLHPSGKLDPVVYGRIGQVFASVEEKEPWLHNTKAVAEIGVFITSNNSNNPMAPSTIEEGVYRMLLEMHYTFQFINNFDDLDRYKLVILPDHFHPTKELAARIDAYVAKGGKILVTGDSAADPKNGNYVLDCIKAGFHGTSEFDMRYIRLTDERFSEIPSIDHILYEKGYVMEARGDEKVGAYIVNPYFNRSYKHFCSHRQTPPCMDATEEPGVIFGENYAIVSSPLFTDYIQSGYMTHREIIKVLLGYLLPEPLVKTDLPAISEMTVRKQEENYIVHILNYVLQKKSKRLEIIEDQYTVVDKVLKVRLDKCPESVVMVPANKELTFTYEDGYAVIELPMISGHTIIEIK